MCSCSARLFSPATIHCLTSSQGASQVQGAIEPVIAPDFPLEFAGFFLGKKLVKRGIYPVLPGKNPVKNTGFSPLYSGTRTSPHPPALPGPGPPSRPGQPSRPGPPCPLQPSGPATANEFFQGSVQFFPRTYWIFSSHEERRKLTYCMEATLPAALRCAAPHRTLCPVILLSLLHVHNIA